MPMLLFRNRTPMTGRIRGNVDASTMASKKLWPTGLDSSVPSPSGRCKRPKVPAGKLLCANERDNNVLRSILLSLRQFFAFTADWAQVEKSFP
uniref:Uncharacterized protein n=1 Tax=Trichuris muris TaxID=70415 RepID=A0A5S6R667_TRIMR